MKQEEWDMVKREVAEREDYRCSVCDKPWQFVDLYVEKIGEGQDTDPSNYTVVCGKCLGE